MGKTRVINLRGKSTVEKQGSIYIGRPSVWGNPYRIGKDGTRVEVIQKYEGYLLSNPELLAALPSLRGRVLACWCAPQEGFKGRLLCHGQILAGLADGRLPKEVEAW